MLKCQMSNVKCQIVAAALVALTLGCNRPKEMAQAVAPPPASPGSITVQIRPSATDLRPNAAYTIVYALANRTALSVKVDRVVTSTRTIISSSPEWRQGVAEPGQSVTVAQVTERAGAPGVQNLTASFVTDRGSFDADPVRLTVTSDAGAAPPLTGKLLARLTITPNPARPGEPVTIAYELIDSTSLPVTISSVQFDSTSPMTKGNPAWVTDRVSANAVGVVARRAVIAKEPGNYTFNGRFTTNRGLIVAPTATLTVAAKEAPKDTGQVSAAIAILPNPVPLGATYRIEYQITNTTGKDVTVNSIGTDFGTIDDSSAEWITATASAGRTTTIARIAGEGAAATSRNKTATFTTSSGNFGAPPVLLIIQ